MLKTVYNPVSSLMLKHVFYFSSLSTLKYLLVSFLLNRLQWKNGKTSVNCFKQACVAGVGSSLGFLAWALSWGNAVYSDYWCWWLLILQGRGAMEAMGKGFQSLMLVPPGAYADNIYSPLLCFLLYSDIMCYPCLFSKHRKDSVNHKS